jgi:ferric-dicitrate binding protein FerR (iron transport regulator)
LGDYELELPAASPRRHGWIALALTGAAAAAAALLLLLPTTEGSRKKEYMLTERGYRVLKNELERLRELVTSGDVILGGLGK